MVIMTVLMCVGVASCSKDDEDDEPKYPVAEFYYKGSCIGTLNKEKNYGKIEIQEPLIGKVGEKIEIETRLISGTGIFLYDINLPSNYISITDTYEEDVTIGSKQIKQLGIFSFEINQKMNNDKLILDFRACDNNGPSRPSIFTDFIITINILGE